jgi:hypothetical protein
MLEDVKNSISQFFILLEINFDELNTILDEEKHTIVTKIQTSESGILI